jgi:cytidylate kinase
MDAHIPVIAIDGPTASGKGTVAARVAEALGWHLLDSGAIYRLLAWSALTQGVALEDGAVLTKLAHELDVRFLADHRVLLDGKDVTADLRREETGNAASRLAAIPEVRAALLERQRTFRQAPGLVADGRDMASIVFPDAFLKIFLTASVEARADRRYKQLIDKGMSANIERLLLDLRERDERDTTRAVAPLKQAEDALLLDTTARSIEQAVQFVLMHAAQRLHDSGKSR